MELLKVAGKSIMKTLALLAALAALIYYHGFSNPASTATDTAAQPRPGRVVAREIVGAPAPSYHDRWKTGPNAFTDLKPTSTDLKTGPNAQVTFEPFLPDEQANWNPNPGYTIVSGAKVRR
jgi:hypothetical protein